MSDAEVFSLSVYNAESVLHYFNIAANNSIEARATRFLFKSFADEYHGEFPELSRREFAREMSEYVIANIEKRYELYKKFADNFFTGMKNIDFTALKMAVICDGFVTHANEDREPRTEKPHHNDNYQPHNDGFGRRTVRKARMIWEEAEALKDYGYYDDQPLKPEVIFLAHVLCLAKIAEVEEDSREEYPEAEMIQKFELFLKSSVQDMQTLLGNSSDIGMELQQKLDDVQTSLPGIISEFSPSVIIKASPPPEPASDKKPALRLIVPSPE